MNADLMIGLATMCFLYFTGLFIIIMTNQSKKIVVPQMPSYDDRLKELALQSTPVHFDYEKHLQPLVECVHREVRERLKDFRLEFKRRTGNNPEFYMTLAEANTMSLEVCNTVKECLSVEYLCMLSRYRSIAGIGRLTKQIADELIVKEAEVINSTIYNESVKQGMHKAKLKKQVETMDSDVKQKVSDLLGITSDELERVATSPSDVFNAFIGGMNKI